MLQKIRDRITGTAALIILAIMCVPFVFFGVDYSFTRSGFAVKVNGEEVSPLEVRQAYENQAAQFRQLGNIPPALDAQLRRSAKESVIRSRVLTQYIADSGYRISDERLQQSIREIPIFQEDGRFSFELYRGALASRGLVPARFEADQRRSLELQQLQAAIADTAFSTPAELRRYIELDRETRTISYLEFGVEDFLDGIELSDEDLQAYYDQHPESFRTPERVTFDYLEISRDTVASRIEISDKELEAFYEDVKSSYARDEERRARHILITTDDDPEAARELAVSLTERAKAGEPFADLAKEYSDDTLSAESGGDLGWVGPGQFVESVEEAIFDMKPGEIRGPVESEFGFHVLRLDEVRGGGTPPLSDIRDELVEAYRADRVGAMYLDLTNRLADQLFDTPDLRDAADAVGLEVRTAVDYTRAGTADLAPAPVMLDALFGDTALPEGGTSDLLNLADDRVMVLQVKQRQEASREPLEAVRDRVAELAKREAASETARSRLDELRRQVEEGKTLEAAAAELGTEAVADREITRAESQLPPALVAAVFAAELPADGEKIGSVASADGGFILYRLTDVSPGNPQSLPPAQREQARVSLARQAGISDFGAFITELRNEADIVDGTAEAFSDQGL